MVVIQEEEIQRPGAAERSPRSKSQAAALLPGEGAETMVSHFPRMFAEAFCGLHGHDSLLQFEQDRMFLRCTSCGHESPGWQLNKTPPTVVADPDARRQTFACPQLTVSG
jgi:hypothetical protein